MKIETNEMICLLRKNFIVLVKSPTIIKFVISEVELQNLRSHSVKMKMTWNVYVIFESQVECEESGGKLYEGEMEKGNSFSLFARRIFWWFMTVNIFYVSFHRIEILFVDLEKH